MNIFETSAVHDYFQFNPRGSILLNTWVQRIQSNHRDLRRAFLALAMKRLFGTAKQAWKDSLRFEVGVADSTEKEPGMLDAT